VFFFWLIFVCFYGSFLGLILCVFMVLFWLIFVWFYGSLPCLRQTGLSFSVDKNEAKILLNHTFPAAKPALRHQ